MSPFQAVYGRTPPKIIDYRAENSNVEAVGVLLKQRDQLLHELRINLQVAQERMKRYADLKRRSYEFDEGSWVWLRLQPYRQNLVNRGTCFKLAKRYYGPFMIEKKISSVAYRLKLPAGCSIFSVFHIALLKPFQGSNMGEMTNPLPPLATKSHPIICPTKIIAYRQIKLRGKSTKQVLVEWAGLPAENRSWEDIDSIQRLMAEDNLEAKIAAEGGRDVTVTLELDAVVKHLKDDLGIGEQAIGDHVKERTNRIRQKKKDDSYIYY